MGLINHRPFRRLVTILKFKAHLKQKPFIAVFTLENLKLSTVIISIDKCKSESGGAKR